MTGKLALRNVRRSLRDYAVYFITLTFGVCLFYVFNSLSGQSVMKLLSQSQHGIVEGICRSMPIGADAAAYAERPTLPNDPRGLGAVFTAAVETAALQRFLKQS